MLLCFADVKMYRVKCLKYRFKAPFGFKRSPLIPVEYLVRFEAWTKKTDEWVTTNRLLPMTRNNVNRMREHNKRATTYAILINILSPFFFYVYSYVNSNFLIYSSLHNN